MRILLTNDDGIESAGLKFLWQRLIVRHEVWVIAPATEHSACSQALSINKPIKVKEIGPRRFAVEGTPTDCVLLGLHELMSVKPEAVLAGINKGANLGTDILYSGTVAAARQGALLGYPAYAFSLAQSLPAKNDLDFEAPATAALVLFEWLYQYAPCHQFYNINFPEDFSFPFTPVLTTPAQRIYHDRYQCVETADGSLYYFLLPGLAETQSAPGTDWEALHKGQVSITPLAVQPGQFADMTLMRGLISGKEFIN